MISVVVPCDNESRVLPLLYERLTAAASDWGDEFEVIVVDDGSDERIWSLVRELHEYDPRWKAVRFSRNFGHQPAVTAGLAHACGDAVIVIDADLQDPPEELWRFLALWREGYEVVYAVRRGRKENVLKRAGYHLFYRVLGRLATEPIPADSGDFCLMDRRVVQVLVANAGADAGLGWVPADRRRVRPARSTLPDPRSLPAWEALNPGIASTSRKRSAEYQGGCGASRLAEPRIPSYTGTLSESGVNRVTGG